LHRDTCASRSDWAPMATVGTLNGGKISGFNETKPN